jgi:dTDP-4-amino-4,6-dideoxygalactose transaminase
MAKLAINGGPKLREKDFPGWPPADAGLKERLAQVIDSGVWGMGGAMQREFVRSFAEFCGANYCVACTSGTTALELALRAARVGPGDEVIVPPYTFIATASAVVSAGAVPVFADIDAETFNLDPKAAEAAINERTAAIIPVHIAGMPAEMDAFTALGAKHGLKIIEDCAQAHGAEYGGKRVGAIGDAGCFSFQSSKNLTSGEGGAVTTSDPEIHARAWSAHNVGRVPEGAWYDHRVLGWNWRITEFQCAVLLRGLEMWPEQDARRQANAAHLRERLADVPGIEPQAFTAGADRCAYHLFACRYEKEGFDGLDRDLFLEGLGAEGIGAWRGYNPLYREGLFADVLSMEKCPLACRFYEGKMDYRALNLPVVERVCEQGSFWLGQHMLIGERADVDDIADAMLKVWENRGELLTR